MSDATYLAFVKRVAQQDGRLRFEECEDSLEGSLHLPLAAQAIKPVPLPRTEQVGVREQKKPQEVLLLLLTGSASTATCARRTGPVTARPQQSQVIDPVLCHEEHDK